MKETFNHRIVLHRNLPYPPEPPFVCILSNRQPLSPSQIFAKMAFSLNYQALMSKALMSEAPFFRSKAQPSYIEKYDQILSISQYAINQQLQHLYNTPLPTCGLPPPNSGPQPPKEYLISHTLHMSNPKNTMSGKIVGNIACPTISWDHVRATDSRTVKMTLLFLPGSNYRCYSLDGTTDPPVMKEEYIDIEGYKFSFEASLGKKNIQHIQDREFHTSRILY